VSAPRRGLIDKLTEELKRSQDVFMSFLYRGLPTSLLLMISAFVQYYAVRAFA
jgi:hypothetical protein